jgi:hypothetical protein
MLDCKECGAIVCKNWRLKNKEKRLAYRKKYNEENKEAIQKYQKKYMQRWLLTHKDHCNELGHKVRYSFEGKKETMYRSIRGRVKFHKQYTNRTLNFTLEEWLGLLKDDKNYKRCYDFWAKHGFLYELTPSADRIDNNKDYYLENMQVIPQFANSLKSNLKGHTSQSVLLNLIKDNLAYHKQEIFKLNFLKTIKLK